MLCGVEKGSLSCECGWVLNLQSAKSGTLIEPHEDPELDVAEQRESEAALDTYTLCGRGGLHAWSMWSPSALQGFGQQEASRFNDH